MRRALRSLVAASAGLLAVGLVPGTALPGPGEGDLLVLKDGRVFSGTRLSRDSGAVVMKFANGDVRVSDSLVEDVLIEGAPLPEPATAEEKEKRAKGLVPFRGRWVPAAEREKALRKEIEDRRKAIDDYKSHSEWKDRYQFKTKNFEFESTQPPWLNEEFAELLETYFKEFSKVWKVRVPQKWGRLKVCFHSSQQEFMRQAGASRNTGAYYRWVEPRELNFYYDRADPVMSVACLFHEANHYLTALMDEKFQYPHWVNEAMAEYYGASQWDPVKKAMSIGGVQHGRLAEVQADIELKKLLSIRDLVTSLGDPYEHYTWGWSFVHFLMETPKYRAKFMRFFVDLAQAPDVGRKPMPWREQYTVMKDGDEILRVFLTRMGLKEKDLEGLQKEWYDHIQKLSGGGGEVIRGLEEAGIKAYQDGFYRFRAPRLLKAAIEKGSRRGFVHVAYASCLMEKGVTGDPGARDAAFQEAVKVMEKAVDLDPLDASVWATRARVNYLGGNPTEGERMLALAKEIDPESRFLDNETWAKLRAAMREME